MPALDVRNFNSRIWLSGGRDQVPDGFCRLARGVAPEQTGSIKSMWPPQLLYPGIRALNLTRYNNQRIAFDGTKIYVNGLANAATGFNGSRATLVTMPPATSIEDYLFLCGAGQNVKMDPSGNVTNWGIVAPTNSMAASNAAVDALVIDAFVGTSGNWGTSGCSVADESTIVAIGAGSLKVNPSANPWRIVNNSTFAAGAPPQDLGNYADGVISLPTDVISFWMFFSATSATAVPPTYLQLDFDVSDGTFKVDYYTLVLGLIPSGSTNPITKVNPTVSVQFQPAQWQQVFFQKQEFLRIGTALNLDWTTVQAVRFSGNNFSGNLYLDNLQIIGGTGLGAGPAVQSGGSEYSYYTVYRNTTTGNQSNPQDVATNVSGVALNAVDLAMVSLSGDAQVGARDLYRTSQENTGPGQTAFYLDTIYDNTTTTYTDTTADVTIPLTLTPWEKSVAVPPNSGNVNYYVDGGNGYIFVLKTAGTTGSAMPAWNIPTATWVALGSFLFGDTVSPLKAAGNIFKVTTPGITGATQPNWAAHATPGDTLFDGTVEYVNDGPAITPDGTAVWTFLSVNSTPVLGNQQLLFDNAPPPETIHDAAGPYQGSMITTGDTAPGFGGMVYISPPGRSESVGVSVAVSGDDDPCQKVVIFQNTLWAITTEKVVRINGTYPNFSPVDTYLNCGTRYPFTVQVTPSEVKYRSADGIRAFTWGDSGLSAFEQIAPIQRGQAVEDIPAFYPTVAGSGRNEYFISNETNLALAVGYTMPCWRTFDIGFNAVYFEEQTGQIIASYGGNIYLWEDQTLAGAPVAFDWEVQTGGIEPDSSREMQSQRIYLDINTAGQQVTPALLVDNASFVLPVVLTTTRQTIELPIQKPGYLFSVNLTANPSTGIIEVFRIAADIV